MGLATWNRNRALQAEEAQRRADRIERQKKASARAAEVAARSAAAAEPISAAEETHQDVRTCAHCGKQLHVRNKTGVCMNCRD